MRFIAKVQGHPEVKRLMIHAVDGGVYLFVYEIEEDGGCSYDQWFEELHHAYDEARDHYGVERERWEEIPDPPQHCQQDWITPARVPGRDTGNPQWGRLEVLRDGKWVEVS